MQKTSIRFFFIAATLLLTVAEASASRLFELNLLRQDPNFPVDSRWFSENVIEEARTNIKKDPQNKAKYLFEIASVKAQQGKFLESLEKMAIIDDDSFKRTPDFLQERAEIKSLLGFDEAAIQDMDRIDRKYQNWKTLWHRSLVLDRAGKTKEANLDFRKAVAEAQRFKFGNNYVDILLTSAKNRKITALEPDPKNKEQILSIIQSLLSYSSAPPLVETIKLIGLDESSFEDSGAGENIYYPISMNCPIKCATITPRGHQIRISFDTAASFITPETVRKQFDAATEQELWPGGMGSSNESLTLYPRHQETVGSQFVFDGAKEPTLKSVFINYKEKSASTKK